MSTEKEKWNKLTKREKEIINLIIKGKSNNEIADILKIAYNTLKTHLNNIYEKLNIKGDKSTKKTQVAVWYLINKHLF